MSPMLMLFLKLMPLLFVMAVATVGIFQVLKESGFIESGEYMEEEVKHDPNKKQTYEEYVRESLRIEKMMRYGFFGRFL